MLKNNSYTIYWPTVDVDVDAAKMTVRWSAYTNETVMLYYIEHTEGWEKVTTDKPGEKYTHDLDVGMLREFTGMHTKGADVCLNFTDRALLFLILVHDSLTARNMEDVLIYAKYGLDARTREAWAEDIYNDLDDFDLYIEDAITILSDDMAWQESLS